jgi:HEAT repeat protein
VEWVAKTGGSWKEGAPEVTWTMLGLSPLPRTLAAALRDVRDKKLEVRISAVRDLARLARAGDREEPLAALCRALADDATAAVRSEAAVALADAAASECIRELTLAAADDDHLRVRQMALIALGEVAPKTSDERVREVVMDAVADESPEIRFQALIALTHVDPEAGDKVILSSLVDDDAHIRYVALRLAEERWLAAEEPSELPELLRARAKKALADSSPKVRLAAAIVLGRAGDRSGESKLVLAINSGEGVEESEDEGAAIDLAGELGLDKARAGLERRAFGVLGVTRHPFAWHARSALARMGDERARAAISKGLRAFGRDARTMAVAAVGRARLVEAREELLSMRGDPTRAEPDAVEEALALLTVSSLPAS